jgi:hypothetical protein
MILIFIQYKNLAYLLSALPGSAESPLSSMALKRTEKEHE